MIIGIIGHVDYLAGNNASFFGCLVVVLIIISIIIFSRSKSSIASRNIADISVEIGYDARDLRMAGYSWKEIEGVVNGEYSLKTLLARGPASKRNIRK
jgi:hypothetical protein